MQKHTLTAALVAASLTAGVLAAPPATAETQNRGFAVDVITGAERGFRTVEANKGRVSWLMYNTPTYGLMPTAFYLDAFVGGQQVGFAGDATKVDTAKEANADTVTMRHTDYAQKAELTRSFVVLPDRVDILVELKNTSNRTKDMRLDLSTGLLGYDYSMKATREGSGFDVSVGGRYTLKTRFDNAQRTGTGGTQQQALSGELSDDSRFQSGTWTKSVAPGEKLSARLTVVGDSSELKDSDGDGFPDEWELHGFTSEEGTEFPLNRWGADPNRPDLFLQLNWMKSEWETLKCSEKRNYAPTEEDFEGFLKCSEANVNVYRPSRATLDDLVKLFDRHGYNLHIDAGYYYNNIAGYDDPQGGPTIDYTPYYFGDETPGLRMLRDRRELLGERQSIFRVGIIGDTQAPGNSSSGNGLLSDGAFYVANNELMTTQEQLRNTILHEFGHNLGLTHSGPASGKNPDHAYVPKYMSVMNYLYQFSYFDYSDAVSTPDSPAPYPQACRDEAGKCFTGNYRISPDWKNLDLINGEIGKSSGVIGVDDDPYESGHLHPDTDQLVVMSAERNQGKGGLRVLNQLDDGQNVIIANRSDSTVNVEIANLGLDIETFKLRTTYPGGKAVRDYPVEGLLTKNGRLAVEVPIVNTAGYTGATMPVRFELFNSKGERVADDAVDFSVLNLTEEQLAELKRNLEKSKSPLIDDFNNTAGKKDPGKPTLTTPAPLPTTNNNRITSAQPRPTVTSLTGAPTSTVNPTPTQPSGAGKVTVTANPAPGGSAQGNTVGIVVGVILGLLAVVGMGAVAADAMGLLR